MANNKTPILCLSLLLLATLLPAASFGAPPAWGFGYGWNEGVQDNLESGDWVVDSRVGNAYSFNLFSGHFQEESRRHRWGFGVTTQMVKTIPEQGDNHATNFRLAILQLEFEHILLRGTFADLVLGFGAGFCWRSDKNENDGWNYCDTALCNLPEFNWVFSPDVKAIIPVVGIWSLTLGVEGNIYSDEAAATYPYKSGVTFLVGIELRGTTGKKGKPADTL